MIKDCRAFGSSGTSADIQVSVVSYTATTMSIKVERDSATRQKIFRVSVVVVAI